MSPCSRAALSASLLVHALALWALLWSRDAQQASSLRLRGEVQALTVFRVAAASPDSPQETPVKAASDAAPAPGGGHAALGPLPRAEGALRPAAKAPPRRPGSGRKKAAAAPAVREAAADRSAQAAQNGKDRQDSEQGRAVVTARRESVGAGDSGRADYAARLRGEIETHKRYPLQARQARVAGSVQVRFRVAEDGRLSDPELVASSGNRSLDRAAIRAVQDSRPVGPRPDGFGPAVSVRIRFNLLAQ